MTSPYRVNARSPDPIPRRGSWRWDLLGGLLVSAGIGATCSLAAAGCAHWTATDAALVEGASTAICAAAVFVPIAGPGIVAVCAGLLPAERAALDGYVRAEAAVTPAPPPVLGQSSVGAPGALVYGTRAGHRVALVYVTPHLAAGVQRRLDGAAR